MVKFYCKPCDYEWKQDTPFCPICGKLCTWITETKRMTKKQWDYLKEQQWKYKKQEITAKCNGSKYLPIEEAIQEFNK